MSMLSPSSEERSPARGRFLKRLRNARHNIIAHPIAGLLWLCGCQQWGDWVHDHL